jgi:2-polyprenyl-3-methyl-5-hydroxy-6-metoxy-1,4-benzoquinol methylase
VENEHFVPAFGLDARTYIAAGDTAGAHHLIRYQWACDVLTRDRPQGAVLDIACGAGYGNFLLAQALPECPVIGADYDDSAIRHAREHDHLPNLKFQHGDVLRWIETLTDRAFAAIVSFDTLEHCPHREIMLENLARHLTDDGRLLFSTPSAWDENRLHPEWTHHKIEYAAASLYDFLARYFREIRRPEESDFPGHMVFDVFEGAPVPYCLRLNPVWCRSPIRVDNPYRA